MDLHVAHLQIRVPARRPRDVTLLPHHFVGHMKLIGLIRHQLQALLLVAATLLIAALAVQGSVVQRARVVGEQLELGRVYAVRLDLEADHAKQVRCLLCVVLKYESEVIVDKVLAVLDET